MTVADLQLFPDPEGDGEEERGRCIADRQSAVHPPNHQSEPLKVHRPETLDEQKRRALECLWEFAVDHEWGELDEWWKRAELTWWHGSLAGCSFCRELVLHGNQQDITEDTEGTEAGS